MGALTSLATTGLNLALAQRASRAEAKELERERDQRIKAIRREDAALGAESARALERRIAQERARAGAAGVGVSGGAIDAILRGLGASEAREAAERDAHSRERIDGIRRGYERRIRGNLLDLDNRWLDLGGRLLGSVGRSGRSLLG
jgi:hypothetical protein